MTVIKRSIVVPYTTAQMFALVNEVEQYPEFLSWCKETRVHDRTQYKMKASIQGYKAGINFAFTIINNLQPNNRIETHLMGGRIFRDFKAFWQFDMLEKEKTKFSFELAFEFVNPFLGWTITPFIKNGSSTLLEEFCQRAKRIYR